MDGVWGRCSPTRDLRLRATRRAAGPTSDLDAARGGAR
ncbi:Hypothetical protein A7982_11733 [Minicystis rosea]|nr:Hypothetical protein A7982_11733 [Minicystis rosea]